MKHVYNGFASHYMTTHKLYISISHLNNKFKYNYRINERINYINIIPK